MTNIKIYLSPRVECLGKIIWYTYINKCICVGTHTYIWTYGIYLDIIYIGRQ